MRVTSYSLLLTPEKTNVLVKEHSKNYSEEDNLANPRKIAKELLGIQMADHVIVSGRAYFSFVEGGLL